MTMATDNVTPMEMEEARESAPQGDEDLTPLYRDALMTWMLFGRAMMEATQAMGGETIGFWHSRTKAGLETARRLAECTSPQTLLEIQMDHGRTTVQAYADQIAKLRAVADRLVREGTTPARGPREVLAVPAPAEIAA
jgi:hypothetical protein